MKPDIKSVITLHDLENLLAERLSAERGKEYKPEFPREITPGWFRFCKSALVWDLQKKNREEQLIYLDLFHSVEIDYYKETSPIRPF